MTAGPWQSHTFMSAKQPAVTTQLGTIAKKDFIIVSVLICFQEPEYPF